MSLSWYLNDAKALLNDQNYSFTSQAQLTRWVNEARRNCAKRTGCIRRLVTGQSGFGAQAMPGLFIPGAAQPGSLPGAFPGLFPSGIAGGGGSDFNPDFNNDFGPAGSPVTLNQIAGAARNTLQTIPGVERYPYVGFFNPYLKAAYAGVDAIIDTIACSVNWGGVSRPTLDWMPWDDLQAYARAYSVLNTSYPSVWSVFNDGPQGEIWMFPIPSQAGEIELDVFATPLDLLTDSDFDAIPDGMRESVKFMAAALAFLSTGRYAQAQAMEDRFADNLGIARVAFDRGKTKSYYFSIP
jgi:hypothetical protein